MKGELFVAVAQIEAPKEMEGIMHVELRDLDRPLVRFIHPGDANCIQTGGYLIMNRGFENETKICVDIYEIDDSFPGYFVKARYINSKMYEF